jgi:nucleotide-binding universal stress UspA family protein
VTPTLPQPHPHPLGIAIAVTFTLLLGGVLWWMLHPPAPVEAMVARALRGVQTIRKILVPVRGRAYNMRALELACRLGDANRAEILPVHVLVVPLSQSLASDLSAEESAASALLDKAREIVEHHGLVARPLVVRERDVARGVLRAAQEQEVDLVVLGINPRSLAAGESVGRATSQLLSRSRIEVIVDMNPGQPGQEADSSEGEGA